MRVMLTGLLLFIFAASSADPGPSSSVRFIQNKGQWPVPYVFGADVRNGVMLFARDRVVFSFEESHHHHFNKVVPKTFQPYIRNESGGLETEYGGHVYQMLFVNANSEVSVFGDEDAITRYNYLIGKDPSAWITNVSSYQSILYECVYNGIDMRYYSGDDQLKYEWIVSPQADVAQIRMKYDGVDKLAIVDDNLFLKTSVNQVTEMKPYAYQIRHGQKVEIPCYYVLNANNTVSYSFPDGYDECLELVIDPILIFSAYSGSTADNWGNTATYDARGNVYSGGIVERPQNTTFFKTKFPVTTGAYQTKYGGGLWDVGILKFDSAGQHLLYCTFLGGDNTETPQSMVVNSKGELLILGTTGSANFPVTNGSTFKGGVAIDPLSGVTYRKGSDLFIAKLSADGGTLLGSTFLGGTNNEGLNMVSGFVDSNSGADSRVASPLAKNYGDELRGDIICDATDNVYIASSTRSPDFPALNSFNGGTHDGVVTKLKPDLSSVVWSRMIGGAGTDVAYSIRIDKTNNLYVAGGSNSATIAGMNGLHTTNQGQVDGWIQSLTNSGALMNGTFLGTDTTDQSYFIDLDEDNNVYAFGQSAGDYHPGQTGVQFIHALSNDLKSTQWVRRVGPGIISPTAFLVSECGYIYISGWGGEINWSRPYYVRGSTFGLPVTADAYQPNTFLNDFYLLVLSKDGTQNLYGTFLGGPDSPTHVDGGTSRFDKHGIVYHAVCAGCHGLSDFPAENVPPAFMTNGAAQGCNNAVFKMDLSLLKANLQTNSVKLDRPGLSVVCLPDPIVFQNLSNGGETYEWDLGDGTKFIRTDKTSVTHHYQNTGQYKVWLKAIDPGTCMGKDSTFRIVNVYTSQVVVMDDATVCAHTPFQLQASGGDVYQWKATDGSFVSNDPAPFVKLSKTTTFDVTVTTAQGCIDDESVTINVTPSIDPAFELDRKEDCFSVPSVFVKNTSTPLNAADQFIFDFGDGTTSDLDETTHKYQNSATYAVKLTAVHDECATEKVIQVPAHRLKIPNVITPGVKENKNDVFTIQVGDNEGLSPLDYDLKTDLVIYNRWGNEIYRAEDYQYNWSGEDVDGGVYYYELTVDTYSTCKGWLQVIK